MNANKQDLYGMAEVYEDPRKPLPKEGRSNIYTKKYFSESKNKKRMKKKSKKKNRK
jgi:hypothetical protein